MPVTKYIIQTHFIDGKIKKFTFDRETEHFLIMKSGSRTKKMSISHETLDTWQQAKNRLVEVQSGRVARLHSQYNTERKKLQKIMQMENKKEK